MYKRGKIQQSCGVPLNLAHDLLVHCSVLAAGVFDTAINVLTLFWLMKEFEKTLSIILHPGL